MSINSFINRYFGLILLAAAICGLFFEIPDLNISRIIIISLAGIIFASFFKITFTRDLLLEDVKSIFLYFLARFVITPIVVFFIFVPLTQFYATSFLLLLLLPTAVSSPAFTVMFGGNLKISLKILVFTSFISILTIPAITYLLLTQTVEIDSKEMLMTMVYTIVYPFILHLPLRGVHFVKKIINNNGPLLTAIGLSIIFIVSTSKNRSLILENPERMLYFAMIAVTFYLLCYIFGYYIMYRQKLEKKIAYSICSGANNIGLGVTLTALFFPGDTNVFFIISQIAWIIILIPLRHFYFKKFKNA